MITQDREVREQIWTFGKSFNHSLRAKLTEDNGNPYWYNQTDKDKAEIVGEQYFEWW